MSKEKEKVRVRVPGIVLDTGEVGSRSAYIRQEFLKDRSRAELAAELNVPYYVVYSATTNMFNAVHTETTGRTSGGGVRGVMVEDPETGNLITRADAMRKMFAAGKTRTEIKEHFDSPYATVYAATKDVEAPEGTTRGRVIVEDVENPGELIARTELIRRLYKNGEGMSRREIADVLGCDYSVVWATTRDNKKDAEEEEEEVEVEKIEVTDGGTDTFIK
ncbi:MAG: hypothetical protein DDT19_01915 [Syntrophomonadaceae bacterium]|nr:hypothetical protein [Bacillota bacterium]